MWPYFVGAAIIGGVSFLFFGSKAHAAAPTPTPKPAPKPAPIAQTQPAQPARPAPGPAAPPPNTELIDAAHAAADRAAAALQSDLIAAEVERTRQAEIAVKKAKAEKAAEQTGVFVPVVTGTPDIPVEGGESGAAP
jgi:type IV secretory pathway VirB10-like protein